MDRKTRRGPKRSESTGDDKGGGPCNNRLCQSAVRWIGDQEMKYATVRDEQNDVSGL
jgi:hypothetical protein